MNLPKTVVSRAFHQEIANDTGGTMGSSSHSLNGPQQIDTTQTAINLERWLESHSHPSNAQGYAPSLLNIQNNRDIIEQGSTTAALQSSAGDPATSCFAAFSHHHDP
uniref:Uncharacterized protein n=1 Tax=Salix viminalis TaxID=40686 RepID=A0A6N2M3A4_SALVM